MISTTPEAPVQPDELTRTSAPAGRPGRTHAVRPVLEKLFELYPHLFGAKFLPLKLGIFQELLATHPGLFEREPLKAALGLHTRSTLYLQSVAAGNKRHDLQGIAVQDVAPEHVCLSILELFRRRQGRNKEDVWPKFRTRLMAAFEASGLTRQDYLSRIHIKDEQANSLLEEALAESEQKQARQEALLRAFDSSGRTVEEFADMYGLDQRVVSAALDKKRQPPNPTLEP
jgi:ProP effector